MSRFDLPKGATLIDPVVPPQDAPQPTTDLPKGATPLPPVEPVVEPPKAVEAPEEPGYLDRLGNLMQKRIERVQRGSKAYSAGEIGYPQFASYGFANAFGALFDVVGESAFTVLGTLLPEDAENFLKETIAAGGNALMDTETARAGLEYYESLTQTQKDAISNALDLGMGALPVSKPGNMLVRSAVQADKAKLSRWVLDDTPTARARRLSEAGMSKRNQNTLNYEDQLLNTVVSLGIKGNTKPKDIISKLNAEISRLGNDIEKSLKGVKTVVPKSSVMKQVDAQVNQFLKSNPEFADMKNLQRVVQQSQQAFETALKQYDGTAVGLLNLRKEFDNIINKTFAKDIFQGENVSREIASVYRNTLNDMAQGLAPNESIRASLRRQHLALQARSNVSENLAKKPHRNAAQKALNLAERHPFATAAAVQGGGMLSKIPEPFVLGASGALGAYGLAQPGVRRLTGEALNTLPVGRGLLYGAIEDFNRQTQEEGKQ